MCANDRLMMCVFTSEDFFLLLPIGPFGIVYLELGHF